MYVSEIHDDLVLEGVKKPSSLFAEKYHPPRNKYIINV